MPPPKLVERPRLVDKLKKGKAVAVSSKQKQGKRSKSADAIELSPLPPLSPPNQGVHSLLKSDEGSKFEQDKAKKLVSGKRRQIALSRKRVLSDKDTKPAQKRQTLVKKSLGNKLALQMSSKKRLPFKSPKHSVGLKRIRSKIRKPLNTVGAVDGCDGKGLGPEWQPVVVLKKLEKHVDSKFLEMERRQESSNGYDIFQTVGLVRVNKEVEKQQESPSKIRYRGRPISVEMSNLSAALKMANDAIINMNICDAASDISESVKYYFSPTPTKTSPMTGSLSPKFATSVQKSKLPSDENIEIIEIDNDSSTSPSDSNETVTSPRNTHVEPIPAKDNSIPVNTSECEELVRNQPYIEHGMKRKYKHNAHAATKKGKMHDSLSTEHDEPVIECSVINIPKNTSQASHEVKSGNSFVRKRNLTVLRHVVVGPPPMDDDVDTDPGNVRNDYCDEATWNTVSMMKLNKKVQELEKAVDSLQTNVSNLTYTVKNKQGQIKALERRLKYYESSKLHAILREVIAGAEKCNSACPEEYTAGFLINLLFAYNQTVLQRRHTVAGEGNAI